MHIETLFQQKLSDFGQNVRDISFLDWMCLGTWISVPEFCGGLITAILLDPAFQFGTCLLNEIDQNLVE